jgi:hypothetical protein
MTDISYRVIPRGKSSFDVEIDRPDGRKQTVPGFQSEHEADAWIIQAKRMIREASPWTPLAPRRPTQAATGETPKAPLPSQAGGSADTEPAVTAVIGKSAPAAPRVRAKTARERSTA